MTILSYWRKVILAQLFPTLCNSLDFSPPGSSVHGILQLRILLWVALSFSRGSFQPRDRTQVSRIAADFLSAEPQGKPTNMKWVAYPFSNGSSQPRNQTGVSCTARGFFTSWALREAWFLCADKQKDLAWSLLSQVSVRPPLKDPKQVSVASERKAWRGPQGDQTELGRFSAAFSARLLFVFTWFAGRKAGRALWVLRVLAPAGRTGHWLASPV